MTRKAKVERKVKDLSRPSVATCVVYSEEMLVRYEANGKLLGAKPREMASFLRLPIKNPTEL